MRPRHKSVYARLTDAGKLGQPRAGEIAVRRKAVRAAGKKHVTDDLGVPARYTAGAD
jgi:hypothetical protein